MKHFAKSTLIALLLFCATAVSQAQRDGDISGSNILGGLFGRYEGDFKAAGRTLPFKTFSLNVYPNGHVEGYLSGPNKEGAYVTGTADKKGQFTAGFYYGGKYYTLTGLVNKGKKAVGVAKPYRKNNTVGNINGNLSKTSYAPSSIAHFYESVYGNGLNLEFYFYDDGSFGAYDYDSDEEFEGDYSYVKLGSNLARLTLYAEDGVHTFLLYYFGNGDGVAYDVGTGTFHYFSGGSED